jgi:hypothetical protein
VLKLAPSVFQCPVVPTNLNTITSLASSFEASLKPGSTKSDDEHHVECAVKKPWHNVEGCQLCSLLDLMNISRSTYSALLFIPGLESTHSIHLLSKNQSQTLVHFVEVSVNLGLVHSFSLMFGVQDVGRGWRT